MQSNPYAPPTAAVADHPQDSHGLVRRRVIVMILFMLVTLGLYYLVWWFRRRPGLNRLNSSTKLALWPLLLMVAVYVTQFIVDIIAGDKPAGDVIGRGGTLLLLVVQLTSAIVMVVQSYKIKDIIEEHGMPDVSSTPMFPARVELSALATFFFSIFYLQWAINRYVVEAGAGATTGAGQPAV